MKIDLKNGTHMQDLNLHLISINDMSIEKWKSFFEDVEVADHALEMVESGSVRTGNYQEATAMALAERIDELGGMVYAVREGAPLPPRSHQATAPTLVHGFPATIHSYMPTPIVGGKEMITTDKGTFFCIPVLKVKLQAIYNLDGFDKVFTSALDAANVDPDVDYVSEVKKKAIVTKMKKCVKDAIDAQLDNVMFEQE